MKKIISIDALNWMNSFLLTTIFVFLIYWYIKTYFSKKEKIISKKFFWINFSISFIALCFLIWSWITFYFLEEIYFLSKEQSIGIKVCFAFCFFSLVLNISFLIYILIFNFNFFLIVENKTSLILGFKKMNLNHFSFKNKKIYFKGKQIKFLTNQQITKQILEIKTN